MRILVVGDVHGNFNWVVDVVIPRAVQVGADKIMQVGDFGFVWPRSSQERDLDGLGTALAEAGIDMHFLPGNHEDFDRLEELQAAACAFSPEGHVQLRPRLYYTGKTAVWEWEGVRFAAVGGATSFDRRFRVLRESWWPQEALTASEAAEARGFGRVGVLFSHDCPVYNPFSLSSDPAGMAHRQLLSDTARVLCPKVWFHGHHHQFQEYSFEHGATSGRVVSLDCDGSAVERNMMTLDF